MSDTTARPSFLDRQRDHALAQIAEQQTEFRRVADIVIPPSSAAAQRGSKRVTDVINLGDDHLVEVTGRDNSVQWTFVVGGKAGNWYHQRQEDAILHLIASRYDSNPNSNVHAAFYAGRVLGLAAIDN